MKSKAFSIGYIDGEWGKLKTMNSDGYYPTGDLVQMHEDGSVSYIRRIGLVVKLQHGEFVDLELIEKALEESPIIT